MSFEPRDYRRHIAVEADYLIERSALLTLDTFSQDQTLRRAFVRSLEIIGEASKKVPEIASFTTGRRGDPCGCRRGACRRRWPLRWRRRLRPMVRARRR